ncbi:amino acid adenylation domain-containing protein, partial [Pyxidicoccus sp. 3LG]
MHHIVSDGWSMGVLVREVAALYESFSQGRPSPLPPLAIQYPDYAVWQRQWLRGATLDAQLGWWRQQLSGLTTLELPTDKPRPPVQTFHGAHVPVALPLAASEKLAALCQREGLTPFMALLAAFQVLLSRYSGQPDIAVGSPIAGRQRSELEGLIGFFVNTLVMRTHVEDSASFVHLLRRVRESALGAYAHQDVPFERLVEELQPTRDLSRSPLFQVIFALQNAPSAAAQAAAQPEARKPELALRPLGDVTLPTVRFELELTLAESPDGYRGVLRYNTDLFEATTAERMAAHFRVLVEGLTSRPEAPLASISLLTPSEREQVLVAWSTATSEFPRSATLPEVFEQVVARFPEQVAVEFGDAKLTYRELDSRANRLAWHLRGLGVGADSCVALAVERSVELIVSLVAIIKAGGAYVPLDLSYPRERITAMLEDTRPVALVTTRAFLDRLPPRELSTVVLEEAALASLPTHAPPPSALPDTLAYVDFTSGSTGRPKGVGTTHRAVLRTLLGVDYARFGPDETLLHLAPISFDASTFEIWGALLHGARLVVMPPRAPSLEELGRVVRDAGVTMLWLTTGLFIQAVESHLEALRPVKQLLTGGDVMSAPHFRRALEALRIPVTHAYGPTETTVFATCARLTHASQTGDSVTLGPPIGNTRVYLLDASGQPVPTGVTGEAYIGGDGLARGYVSQPHLTAERFVPDPFSDLPGARLYRTGDLMRWRADGMLEFVGRADAQVKVRGFRIELGEIEAALLAFPEVREAVVVAREDGPGDKRLVGYVVAPESLDLLALRAALKQRLPEYMVPSALGRLDAMPLTANGKLDRKALPAPSTFQTRALTRAPRTERERELAAIWARALHLDAVGAEDDFFELGGHSLTATQVLSRIRQHFRVELTFGEFFSAPTIAALAHRIDELTASRPASAQPLLRPRAQGTLLPLSFAQQRLWFFSKLDPDSAAYNLPFAVRMEGALDVPALARALRDVLQRHESLRTTFQEHEHQPVQVIAERPALPAGFVDLAALPEAERTDSLQRLIEHDAVQPFDLAAGPLWRVHLVRLAEQEHALLLNLHHVISDGWSMGVLFGELAALYTAHATGRPALLEPLPVQYPDYALWQREWLRDEVMDAQLGWWRQQLQGAPRALELPGDKPRPATQTFRGAALPFHFPKELSDALDALCRQEGATPSMVVLAAFQALLARYSGQDDVSIGSPIAGRTHAELEGLIGFFVNTLVLRTKLDGDPSFRTLLSRVRGTTLGAYTHQDVPFEKLVEVLRPERDAGRSPLFQVMLAYQNAPMPEVMGPGLRLVPVDIDRSSAKFDLTLAVNDSGNGLVGSLEYSSDLFDASTAARMVDHLRELLTAALADPDRPLSTVPMLTLDERKLLFHDWREPAPASAAYDSLYRLLQAQARLTPDTVAAELDGQTLTWSELYQRAREVHRSLLSRGLVELPAPPPLVPVQRMGAALPVSFAQQRLWLLDQLEPGNATYNLPTAVRLTGELDAEALQQALTELVRRHESLRTTIREQHGEPIQVIAPVAELPLRGVDLTALGATAPDEARRLLAEEAARGFDLATGPLLRAVLMKLAPAEHVLVLNMHHIVSDGWSMEVLVRELTVLYAAHVTGQPAPLPLLPVQYADFAAWQRSWLKDEVLERQLTWWRQQLSGSAPVLELPTDRPRPAVQSNRGAYHPLQLSRAVTDALQALCQREGVTPFMALLAAWQLLLARYSGQDDISVGSPIAGRTRAETEGLIGFFVNTLVLRTRLSEAPSFRALLSQVRRTTLGAYARQDLPFEELVKAVNPERSLGHAPLFQVKLVLQNAPTSRLEVPGLALSGLEGSTGVARFDMTLAVTEAPEGLAWLCEYSTELFEAETIARMFGNLRTVLEAAVARPDAPLHSLPLLTDGEQQTLLREWSTGPAAPAEAVAHQLFEAQAARTPDTIAVSMGDQRLTYRELDTRANQLAHYLQARGVGPDMRVALCVERSLDFVISILGILKAGGAWLPLDPSLPQERLAFMLQDAAPPVLVTWERLADELPNRGELVVCLDAEADAIARGATQAPSVAVSPEHLAYVIYTSGSTGRPKGTLLTHRGLCNTARAAAGLLHLGPGKTALQFAAPGFDASVWEMFSALLSGSRLVLSDSDNLLPGDPLHALLSREAVTTVTLTPSTLARLAPEALPALETVAAAGEAVSSELVRRWGPGRRFLNAYGPTEVAVCASVSDDVAPERPTIGRPLPGVDVYVLDARLQPVPVGVPGELLVGGLGLARAYLGRPELTADRFVPHPYAPTPGARLYRTGDRVRWLKDGTLEFLGRADSQVKLRGFRIELGEVESVLSSHPSVNQAVAMMREDIPGDPRLVAWFVPEEGESVDTSALRTWLQQRLPDYMVPSAFVSMAAFPLSSSDKVDRKALPAPDANTSRQDTFVPPSSPTEELIAALWSEVLHVDTVGAKDDFFALGGHSLLATQLISRVRETFRVELHLREFFEAPTLSALAVRIDAAVRAGHGLQAPPLVPVSREGTLPLSFSQQRLWFIDQLEPGSAAYNIPTGLRLTGTLDAGALERAFTEVVRRHEALRTTFVSVGGQAAQHIAPPAAFPLATVDLTALPAGTREAEVRRIVSAEAVRPFDLARGPLLRATLLKLEAGEHVLLLVMHHIISDGWSMGVLVREVTALYAAFTSGRPSPLPELPVQYADFSAWQRGWLQGAALDAQLGWWREQLEGAPPLLELPTDNPRPAVPTYRGARFNTVLPRELSEALRTISRRESTTLFSVLLAAYQAWLSRLSGQRDVVVGTVIAQRNQAKTEDLIGFFVNQLALRARLDGDPSVRQLLARTHETVLAAHAHQELPFEELVKALNPERSRAHAPIFQVQLVLQNTPPPVLDVPGLSFSSVELDTASTRQDLLLSVMETEQGLSCTWEYDRDLFEPATIERWVASFQRLLEAFVSEPEQRLSRLRLLSDDEQRQLLVEWNDTARPLADAPSLHGLVEASAERSPTALAIDGGERQLRYGELDRRANQ